MKDYATFGAVIPISGSLSPAVDLRGYVPYGIQMPAAWDAASLTFQVSDDGTNFANLYDDTAEYSLSTAASRAIGFPGGNVFTGWKYIKIRSGTSGTPVNQSANRTVKLICRSED